MVFDDPARRNRIRRQLAEAERRRRKEMWDVVQANYRNRRRRIIQRFPAIDLGPLPVELVNAALGCDLAPGIVHFSSANQDHAFDRHDTKFLSCLPHLSAVVLTPEYIGQSPHHPEGFELVRGFGEVSEIGGYVLVAVTLELTAGDRYMVQSVYPIGEGAVYRRLKKRHLFRVGEL